VLLTALATIKSFGILLRTRPRITLATGGYVSVPVVIASWILRVPIVLFLPDVVPGKAVRWLAHLARRVAVATDASLAYLPRQKVVVTGYPARAFFRDVPRAVGRRRFDLPPDAQVLCVFGGSQGSRSINEALADALPHLLKRYWVLHVCGEKRYEEAEDAVARLPLEHRVRYRLFPYLHDAQMADALASADLALCRSGASILGELPLTGTPAILVPFPEPGVHQHENAGFLAEAGAAVIVDDADLCRRLAGMVDDLLGDVGRLSAMSEACRRLARPDAARDIAELVWREAG
jgi:UDP-N-acetylglucosamine--N-acetylmuramyl-(pentapeptide) pyrophosphoryl-undecaprenol N-acetylglucosamine transferase